MIDIAMVMLTKAMELPIRIMKTKRCKHTEARDDANESMAELIIIMMMVGVVMSMMSELVLLSRGLLLIVVR